MTEPQTWALLGIFATVTLGGMTLMATLINRATTAAIEGLRGELSGDISGLRGELRGDMQGLRGEMNARFEAVDARFEAVNARFEAATTESRVEFAGIKKSLANLDTDVAVLTRRAWDERDGR